jgi:hypothetical protein
MRRERLTWDDVDALIDHLIPQFDHTFDGMLIITRGGIVPGGLLAAALQIEQVLTAAVDFPAEAEMNASRKGSQFYTWPKFLQFPDDKMLTCVLHFNPYRNLFGNFRPDFFAATTDAYIVYPWESRRGGEHAFLAGFDQ